MPNFVDIHKNSLLCLGKSNKKEERSKISDNEKKRLRIVPGAPTLIFSQGNQNHPWHQHCIIWVINLRHNISSGLSKSIFLSFIINIECNSAVILLWDITEKKRNKNTL